MNDSARDVLCVSATQVGKTYALACWMLARMWEYQGAHVHWWLAPTHNQVLAGYRLMRALAYSAGALRSEVMTPYPRLTLVNGKQAEFRSWEREQNLAGTTIAGGVIDEAGLLDPKAQAIISTRRSETLGPLRYIGNPGPVAGPFRRLCNLASEDSSGVYGFHRWTWQDKLACLTGEPRAAYEAFIEQERRSLPDFEFRRLYDAEWTEDEAAVFRGVEAVVDGEHLLGPDDDRYVLGVDVAQMADYLAVVSMGVNTRRIELRDRMRGVPYPDAAQRIHGIQQALGAPIVVEVNGPGIALVQELERLGCNYIPFTTSNQSKQEIVLSLASDIQEGRVTVGDHAPLPYELSTYRYERTPSGTYRYSAPAGEHDDTVMAACFARYGVGSGIGATDFGWLA